MKVKAFQTDIEIAIPEIRELGLEKNFLDPRSGVAFNVGEISLVREGYDAMHKHWYGPNAIGSFEDPPATATVSQKNEPDLVFQAFLDTEDMEIGYTDMSGIKLEMRKSFGHFFNKADFITWEDLASRIDPVTNKSWLDFNTLGVSCPFLIVPNNIRMQRAYAVAQVAISLYQLYSITYEIAALAASAADITYIVAAIIQAIALAVFLILALVLFLQSAIRLKELYFPNLRFLKAYNDFILLRQFCKSEGYTLESNLLQFELFGMYTMGRPEAITGQSVFQTLDDEYNGSSFNKGYPTAEDSTPTPGSFIDYILKTFNARITIFDSVVRLERESTFQSTASIEVIPANSEQEEHDNRYSLNKGDEWARMYDHWQDDYQDKHSIEVNKIMKSEQLTKPINVDNPDLFRLKFLNENSAPFAPAKRKKGLNRFEEFAISFLAEFDGLINLSGGSGNSTAGITGRDGAMIIEQEYFAISKKLWLDVDNDGIGKQPENFQSILSMESIFSLFKQDLKVNVNTKRVQKMTVPFTAANFASLLQNPYVNYKGLQDAVEVIYANFNDRQYQVELRMLLPDTSGENTQTIQL